MPAVTMTAAVGAKRHGSTGSGSGSERPTRAKAAMTQSSVQMAGAGAAAQAAQGCGKVTQEKTGEGRRWCERKANPSPLFIGLMRQPKSHFPLNFAIIANLAKPASPPTLQNF